MKLDLTTEPADSFADIRLFQNIGKFHPLPLNSGEFALVSSSAAARTRLPKNHACRLIALAGPSEGDLRGSLATGDAP
jgi:hypothetical protein